MRISKFVFASVAVAGFTSSAYSFTLTDDPSVAGPNTIYYGGDNTYNGADIIGSSPPFSIFSAEINRTTTNGLNDTLNIKIFTNYAGQNGVDGTHYGSLFLNPLIWSVTGTAGSHYSNDSFVNGNQNWAYAVTTPGSSGATGLYATGLNAAGPSGVGLETDYHNVPQSYATTDGRIVLSNVNGNPITAGAPSNAQYNPGFYFREGQAVQFNPTNSSSAPVTFTVGSNFLEYSIIDGGNLLGNSFALSWAMTCGNDVIQGFVTLSNTDLQPTPLPTALPLFAGGLGILGLIGRRRRRKLVAA